MNESAHDDVVHPTHCFCHVSYEELKKWAYKRYQEGKSTTDLLASTDDPHEKEIISIVALLDVDDQKMLVMMGNVDLPEHHILHCRDQVKAMLDKDFCT